MPFFSKFFCKIRSFFEKKIFIKKWLKIAKKFGKIRKTDKRKIFVVIENVIGGAICNFGSGRRILAFSVYDEFFYFFGK